MSIKQGRPGKIRETRGCSEAVLAGMAKMQILGEGDQLSCHLFDKSIFKINRSLLSGLFCAQRRLEQPRPRRPSSPATTQFLHLYHERCPPVCRSRRRYPPLLTGATGTAGLRSIGAAWGGGGGTGAADGADCVVADFSRLVAGTGHVRTGGGRAAVVPEKAAAAPLPAAIGLEAACCRPRHLEVADYGGQSRQAV